MDTSVLPFNSETSRALPGWVSPPETTGGPPANLVPRSPQWWVYTLNKALDERRPHLDRLDAYYDGNHPLPVAPKKAHDAFRRLMRMSRSNWMELVVDAVEERAKVEGFRFGSDAQADKQAWKMWQANAMDVGSKTVTSNSLIHGTSYVTVAPNYDDPRNPFITPEEATQVIVATDPANHRRRFAAFKKWLDDSGHVFAVLYLPDWVVKLRSEDPVKTVDPAGQNIRWEARYVDNEDWPIFNEIGEVTVVPFPNKPRKGRGTSEIASLTDIQDRINKTLFDRLMAAEFSAFRQRWVTGMDIPTDPVTNQPREPFQAAVDRVWHSEDPNTKFGEFNETNLAGYIASVEADIQHLAAISRTPPHYLLGQSGAIPSGESLKSTETGLVAKVNERTVYWGESWEEVMRLAFRAAGSPKANRTDTETIWRNPESRTLGELTDSLVKLRQVLGAPLEALWSQYGLSPQQIEQWKAMRVAETAAGIPDPLALPATPTAPDVMSRAD